MVLPIATPNILESAVPEKAPEKSNAQKRCEGNGGTWDGEKCIMPEPKVKKPTVPTKADGTAITSRDLTPEGWEAFRISQGFQPKDKSQFGQLTDAETGRLSGFEQGGKTYLGVSPEDTRKSLEAEAAKQELQIGGQAEAVLEQRRAALQNTGLDLSAQVGQEPLQKLQAKFTAQQVDYIAALKSASLGIIPDLIGGAATVGGAVYGAGAVATAATGGAAAPIAATTIGGAAFIGAVLNGINGFFTDFVSDIKRQKSEIIETPIRTLTETKGTLQDITSAQNANPANAKENLEAFNSQMQLLDDEYDRLKDLTDDDLNEFLGDTGINQLQEYEVYFIPNGERDRQIADFQLALANPDPSRINPSTATIEQINKRIEEELAKLQK